MKQEIHGSTSVMSHFIAQAWVITMATLSPSDLTSQGKKNFFFFFTLHSGRPTHTLLVQLHIQHDPERKKK